MHGRDATPRTVDASAPAGAPAWSSLAARGCRRRIQADPARPQAAEHAARARPCCPSASRSRCSPATRCRRWPTRRTRSSSCCRRRRRGLRLVVEDRHRGRAGDAHRGRVLPADRARLPQRRRRLRGGHRQPRADGRRDRGQRAARRLRAHRGGVDLVGRAVRRGGDALRSRPRGDWSPCVLVLLLAALNLRGVRESGTFFAVPTYCFMVAILGMCGLGLPRMLRRGPARRRERATCTIIPEPRATGPAAHHGRADLPAGPRVLVGLCRADRRRGDLQRRAGVPQAEEPQRRDHAAAARADRGHDDAQRHRAGQPDGAASTSTRTTSSGSHGRTASRLPRRLRPAHRDRPDRPRESSTTSRPASTSSSR